MPARHPFTVFIVEDEPAIRSVLKTLLKYLDCAIIEAVDGPEALRLAATTQYDLAIVDHYLPTLDGTSVCHFIEDTHPHVPVVLTSGVPQALLNATPGIGLLPKPYGLIEVSALVDAVRSRRIHAGSRWRAPARVCLDKPITQSV